MTEPIPFQPVTLAAAVPVMELADAVEAVRGQLVEAMSRGAGKDLRFTLGEVELEFALSLTQDSNLTGGIRVWVLNAGGSAGESVANTHRVKITLKPVDPRTGEPVQVYDTADPARSR